jgi:hypothetical protein
LSYVASNFLIIDNIAYCLYHIYYGSFWENHLDEENEWNEQGSTDGDINRDDKTQDESEKIMPVTM